MDNKILIIIALVLFVVHEFEEIAFIKPWIEKNNTNPNLQRHYFMRLKRIRTEVIALLIGEEILLVSLFSILSILFKDYTFITAFFGVYIIHLIGHVSEIFIYREYCPSIITSTITLPIFIWIIYHLFKNITFPNFILWLLLSLILVLLNFRFINYLEPRLNRWFEAYVSN